MRLKTLRKERPAFEKEGAVINGNRLDLSSCDVKPTKHRSNTDFALPASLDPESSTETISPSDQAHEMSFPFRQSIVLPITAPSPSNIPSYPAIEAAYLEQGIRIRLSPTKVTPTGQLSERRSVNSIQRHTAFASRNPSRTSSVLHYATTNEDQHRDSRPFSALQETSSNDFDQSKGHNVSYAQSSQINDEKQSDFYASSMMASETSNSILPLKKMSLTRSVTTSAAPLNNDTDLAYMSSLLKTANGDCFRDVIRRRAGLRGTFAVHRNSLTISNALQPHPSPEQPRERSPETTRHSLTRNATIAVLPLPPAKKIDKDILKHALRIRQTSPSKQQLSQSLRIDASPTTTVLPPRTAHMTHQKRTSANRPLKSISLTPLERLLSPSTRSASLMTRDLPSIKTASPTRHHKPTKSPKIPTVDNLNTKRPEHSASLSVLRDDSLALMKTSPLDMIPQSNSFDSGCYDQSSSSGDMQSLISSSIMQMPSSTPSARLPSSIARRSHISKKVSFYEEPTAIILTTATYV